MDVDSPSPTRGSSGSLRVDCRDSPLEHCQRICCETTRSSSRDEQKLPRPAAVVAPTRLGHPTVGVADPRRGAAGDLAHQAADADRMINAPSARTGMMCAVSQSTHLRRRMVPTRLHKLPPLAIALVVLGAFGPYVTGGVRMEQFVVYGLAVLATFAAIPVASSVRLLWRLVVVLGFWVIYVGVAALAPPAVAAPYVSQSFLAGMDNVLVPLAVSGLCISLVSLGGQPSRLVSQICLLMPVMMLVNTAAALLQYIGIASWDQWWSSAKTSTAVFAQTNGRFSGLIGSPAEGGALYGIAMLCAIQRWSTKPAQLIVVLAVLTFGGVLTVSKVFLLVALPIVLVQMLTIRHGRTFRIALVVVAVFGLWLSAQARLLPVWAGANQLRELAPQDGRSLIATLTAGRFGEQGSLRPVTEAVLDRNPMFGFGAAGLRVPYDNGWVEALVMAGVVGFICYTVALGVFLLSGFKARQPLFWGLALLAVGASFGVPALTANRVGVIFWLLLMLLLLTPKADSGSVDHDGRGADRTGSVVDGSGNDAPRLGECAESNITTQPTDGLGRPDVHPAARGRSGAFECPNPDFELLARAAPRRQGRPELVHQRHLVIALAPCVPQQHPGSPSQEERGPGEAPVSASCG